jgi:sulfite exporter TauE/SafE
MCGGIVAALSLGLPPDDRAVRWRYQLSYNAGRIFSYSLAGGLFGSIGWLASHWSGIHQVQLGLQLLAAFFMVALGLYLGGWWNGLTRIEQLGGVIWKRIEPLGRRFLPVRSSGQALLLGTIWGWLPCGLVYSVLVWAIAAGSPVQGALLLLSFGLGTLPNLLLMGAAADRLAAQVRDPRTRRLAGLLVCGFGLYSLYTIIR